MIGLSSRLTIARVLCLASALVSYFAACGSIAAEPDLRAELPRIEPLSPVDALESFEVADGYRIELAAAEPLVVDPIAMAFDAQGRLFVVEMRGYSQDADKHLGRVRLLTDVDLDGRFDESAVFMDNLSWPMSTPTVSPTFANDCLQALGGEMFKDWSTH